MRQALVLLLVLPFLSACSFFGEGPGRMPGEIYLINATGEALYYSAWGREASHRVDPLPSFDPQSGEPFPALAAGASILVQDISDYEPGGGVSFFLYALRHDEGEEAARLVRVLTVEAEQLRRTGGRVVVPEVEG